MADYYMAAIFQNIVDWEPVISIGFHADIPAVVGCQPISRFAQTSRISRKPTRLILCGSLRVRGSDTGYEEVPMNIHPAANGVYDFKPSFQAPMSRT